MTRIVIIEKEEDVLRTLQKGLRRDDIEVIAAHNSQEAFDTISTGKPDMVLLDAQLCSCLLAPTPKKACSMPSLTIALSRMYTKNS